MEYWIIYHVDSGEPLIRGSGSTGTAAFQQLPEGSALIVVPFAAVASPEIDVAALRAHAVAQVDQAAEQVRLNYLTPGSGRALTYRRKEDEARAFLVDPAAPTPFLSAEAAALGIDVPQLAAVVVQQADAWVAAGSAIEACRMGAKKAMVEAMDFAGIVRACAFEWPSAQPVDVSA